MGNHGRFPGYASHKRGIVGVSSGNDVRRLLCDAWKRYNRGVEIAQPRILTIGYGHRSTEDFIRLLKRYGVDSVVDIRSYPHSRYQPEFSRDSLRDAVALAGIRYAFMGDALGGRPDDPACYVDGKVDYAICRERPVYLEAIERLRRAAEKSPAIALMCSEAKPHECHRAKLVGASLAEMGVSVEHVDAKGELRPQSEILALVTGGQASLFGSAFLRSRKRYTPRMSKAEQ